jgi:hypothetical protein
MCVIPVSLFWFEFSLEDLGERESSEELLPTTTEMEKRCE